MPYFIPKWSKCIPYISDLNAGSAFFGSSLHKGVLPGEGFNTRDVYFANVMIDRRILNIYNVGKKSSVLVS